MEELEKRPVSDIMSVLNDPRVTVTSHHRTYFIDKEDCEDIYTKLIDNDFPLREGASIIVTDDNGDRIIAIGDGIRSFKESIINQHSELDGDFLKLGELSLVEGDGSKAIEIKGKDGVETITLNKDYIGVTATVDGYAYDRNIWFNQGKKGNCNLTFPNDGGFIPISVNKEKANGAGDIEFKPKNLLDIFNKFTDFDKRQFKTIMGL